MNNLNVDFYCPVVSVYFQTARIRKEFNSCSKDIDSIEQTAGYNLSTLSKQIFLFVRSMLPLERQAKCTEAQSIQPKKSGLSFRNSRVSKGTEFST